jgi:hypothetical protein
MQSVTHPYTVRRPTKPHSFFLQRWLLASCQMTCFYSFGPPMVLFLGTDIVISVAVVHKVQPYSYTCSCSTPAPSNISTLSSTPSDLDLPGSFPFICKEVSPLPVIPEGFESELQVTPIVKILPKLASEFVLPPVSHPVPCLVAPCSSSLIFLPKTFTANLKAINISVEIDPYY